MVECPLVAAKSPRSWLTRSQSLCVIHLQAHSAENLDRRKPTRSRRRLPGMRITIRVRPGAARPGVGGEHAGALVVRVSARAVDGRATEAALAAVAEAFRVRRQDVALVTGTASRTKIVDVTGAEPAVLARLLTL